MGPGCASGRAITGSSPVGGCWPGRSSAPATTCRRLEMIAEVEAALREVDVLLCASAMDPPSRIDDAEETERTYPRQARTPFNVTGHPALAMMAGLSSNG